VLQSCGSPNLNLGAAACHNPFAKDDQFCDALNATARQLELPNFFPALENPYATLGFGFWARPGCKHNLLPCQRCGDVFRSLWARYEDEVETALEIVCLEGAPDGGCDLEGSLSERKRRERNASRRYKAYCLMPGLVVCTPKKRLYDGAGAYSEGREYLGLANKWRRALFTVALCFLTLAHWASDGTVRHLGTCHVEVQLGGNERRDANIC